MMVRGARWSTPEAGGEVLAVIVAVVEVPATVAEVPNFHVVSVMTNRRILKL